MDATTPYIRTQAELLADIEALIRDTSNARFTDAEIYRAINHALMVWADKVKLLYQYALPNGFAAGTKEYTLPRYIRPPIFPEIYLPNPYFEHAVESYSYEWRDVQGWDLQPDGATTSTLTVYNPRSELGQVWFYAPNSRVPTTSPTTNESITDTGVTLRLNGHVDIDDVGIIKVDAEYISYTGVGRVGATTLLSGLVRGLYGTTAASHEASTTVLWCVGADTLSLYNQLYNQVRAVLAEMPQFDGSTHERSIYQQLMGYYQNLADEYWATYAPQRRVAPQRLNRASYAFR